MVLKYEKSRRIINPIRQMTKGRDGKICHKGQEKGTQCEVEQERGFPDDSEIFKFVSEI